MLTFFAVLAGTVGVALIRSVKGLGICETPSLNHSCVGL